MLNLLPMSGDALRLPPPMSPSEGSVQMRTRFRTAGGMERGAVAPPVGEEAARVRTTLPLEAETEATQLTLRTRGAGAAERNENQRGKHKIGQKTQQNEMGK